MQIAGSGRPFGGDNEDVGSSIEPGDGIAKTPQPVSLTSVDLAALANEFSSEIEFQQAAQETFYQDLIRWNKIYRGTPLQQEKNYPLAHASNVVVKVAKIFTDQVVARIYQGIAPLNPPWIVTELSRKFAESCKPYERFLDWSSKNMWDQQKFLLPFIQDCVKLGTAVGYNDYVNDPVVRYNDQTKQTEILGYRKGPRPTWVPREDFLIPIGFPDLQKSPWIAHRVWFSWDLLEQLSYQGFIQDLDDLAGNSDEEDQVKVERRRHEEQVVLKTADNRFGLWAPWWIWFRRDLDNDGWPEQYVMLLHPKTKTILRLVANPSPSATRPYFKSTFINVQNEFDGIGIPEDVESLQEEVSTIHNQRRDRAHLANIVMYIAKSATQLPDTIRPKSGLVIKAPGGRDDIQEFSPSIGQIPIDMAEEAAVMNLAAQTVGMSDIDLEKMSSPTGRAAATTIMAIMQEGARRFDLNVAGVRGALTEEAHQITELWQVYGLPAPEETGSPEQVLDEKDAQLVRALLEQPASLRGIVNIQLNASTAAVNRQAEQQGNMQLVGMVNQYVQQITQMAATIANPMVPPEIKAIMTHSIEGLDKLYDKLFQSFDAFDLTSILAAEIVEEMFQKSMMQQQQMQAMGINPQQLAMAQQAQGGGNGKPQAQPKPAAPVGPPGSPSNGGLQ